MCYKLILCKVLIIQSETIKAAVNEVLEGRPLNVEACEFNIDQMTLERYCRKKKLNPNDSFKPNYNNKQVFTAEVKKMFIKLFTTCIKNEI